MHHHNWSYLKYKHKEYKIDKMKVFNSFESNAFNLQNQKYISIEYLKYSYTKLYKSPPPSSIMAVFHFFIN